MHSEPCSIYQYYRNTFMHNKYIIHVTCICILSREFQRLKKRSISIPHFITYIYIHILPKKLHYQSKSKDTNALINPHTTPMAAEPKNMPRNRPTAENTAWVLLVICTEGSAYSNTVLKEHARYMYIKGVTVLTKAYSLKFIAC